MISEKFKVRKTVAIISICVLSIIALFGFIYCLVNKLELSMTVGSIITFMIGFLGYYAGQSTMREGVKTGEEAIEERDKYM